MIDNLEDIDLFKELNTEFISDVHSHHLKRSPITAYVKPVEFGFHSQYSLILTLAIFHLFKFCLTEPLTVAVQTKAPTIITIITNESLVKILNLPILNKYFFLSESK